MKEITLPREDLIRALSDLELFASCSLSEKLELSHSAKVLWFNDGEMIVREGALGGGFYIVLSGHARVASGNRTLTLIEPGGFFGEIAPLEGLPRTADVVASGETVLLALSKSDFRSLLVREPRIAMVVLEQERERLSRSGVGTANDVLAESAEQGNTNSN